jgi:hypothetical protein
MATRDKTIVVTGATGRQGGAVARHLLAQQWPIRALTRNVNSAAARLLAAQGAQVVKRRSTTPRAWRLRWRAHTVFIACKTFGSQASAKSCNKVAPSPTLPRRRGSNISFTPRWAARPKAPASSAPPTYAIALEWEGDEVKLIRDYRYVPYLVSVLVLENV